MIDREIMEAFITESREHLATIEEEILGLERGDVDPERINALYRALHTVKGAASFLGLRKPTELAHALEDVLGQLRAGALRPNEELTEALLAGVDKLKQFVDRPEDESPTIEAEVAALNRILLGDGAGDGDEPAEATLAAEVAAAAAPLRSAPVTSGAELGSAGTAGPPAPGQPCTEADGESPAGPAATAAKSQSGESSPTSVGADTVRISLAVLDKLMNLGGELVLVRNQVLQAIDSANPEHLSAVGQRLNAVTSELQGTIMQTRMRPVGDVFSRYRRVVRDLARTRHKQVELAIDGADVELDKNIIEAIKDPLTHLVRNAVDHGIESPSERAAKGKSLRGTIVLGAFHHGGQVHIRVADDGKGMDPAALKERAIECGLITREQSELMAAREAFNLIFTPGFSMAREVTDISGRGVGMDVVKASFNRLGGVIDVASTVDVGSAITVRLPLTLAIVPALIVAVEDVCFAVPQLNIDEVVWLYGDKVHQSLDMVDDQEVYWLRGKLLPVLRLSKLLDIPKTFTAGGGDKVDDRRDQRPDRRAGRSAIEQESRRGLIERRLSFRNSVYILVLELGNESFGLLVDRVIDTEEIVVKALHDQLKSCGAFAGTTVLGDGRIAMILDVAAVVELAGLSYRQVDTALRPQRSSSEAPRTALLFDVGGSEHFAAPLASITRVEEIRRSDIQIASGREYLRYRGQVLPLLRLERAIDDIEVDYPDEPLYVIIPKCSRPFGVLAARILDTVEIGVDIDTETVTARGIFGTSVVDSKLTLLVDFFAVLDYIDPEGLRPEGRRPQRPAVALLVEDSEFIAAQISNHLKSAGVTVRRAVNGAEGLERLGEELPDLIISDIEMPVMDGLEFAQRVRADARTRDIPLYAVSAMVDDSLAARSLEAGFDAFQSKNDSGGLFQRLLAWCHGEVE